MLRAHPPHRRPTGGATAVPTRILVVDDEPLVRTFLRQMLTLEGYDVAEAGDGESALDAVRCDAPHLVLLDVSLPNRSGLDLLEDLRHTTDVPVILVTGSDEEGDRAAGLRLGADDYIVKPFAAADFTARVESVLRRSPALESGTAIRPPRGLSRDLRPSGGAS